MNPLDIIQSPLHVGLSVIESSAGTGKTYALSHLVPRLLLEGLATDIGKILLVTFTNDAARELSERVRKVLETLHAPPSPRETETIRQLREKFSDKLREGIIAKALLDIDQLRVSTIHSFCQQILQTEGALCGLPTIPQLLTRTDDIAEDILHHIWEEEVAENPFVSSLATIQKWSFRTHLSRVKTHLKNHSALPIPNVENFKTAKNRSLEGLRQTLSKINATVCQEARNIIVQVQTWNKNKDPKQTGIIEKTDLLEKATEMASSRILDALVTAKELPSYINGRTEKILCAEAKECALVQLSKEAEEHIQLLEWTFFIHCLRRTHQEVESHLKANRLISYDGLISHLHHALTEGVKKERLVERLRERFAIALIDESQDTDPQQFEIFRRVFLGSANHRLILIGDPKQAIYSFRGADVNTYLKARDQAGSQIFQLHKTFRSPQPLVDAWNALFHRAHVFLKEDLKYEPAVSGLESDTFLSLDGEPQEARLTFWVAPDQEDQNDNIYTNTRQCIRHISEQTASEIVRLLKSGRLIRTEREETSSVSVQPGNIAVLVSTGRQAQSMEKALKARNIPSVRAGGDDVMSSEEASDLLILLQALDEPRRSNLRFAALATRFLGRTQQDLRRLSESEDAMLTEFTRWKQEALRFGPSAAIALMDREEGIAIRLANGTDGDRRVTNFRHLCDLLQSAQAAYGNRMERILRWVSEEVTRATGQSEADERQIQLESDAEAVRIVTMHKAKGLEYDLVFCPFLWDMRGFPKEKPPEKLSQKNEKDLLICREQDNSLDETLERVAFEERLRLIYVAITRGKVHVWIHAGACTGNKKATPLDWLLIPPSSQGPTVSDKVFSEWKAAVIQPQSDGSPFPKGKIHAQALDALMESLERPVLTYFPPPLPHLEKYAFSKTIGETLSAEAPPLIPEPWALTSFSALTREENPHWAPEPPMEDTDSIGVSPSLPFSSFLTAMGGRVVGDAIHHWIQEWNFSKPQEEAVKTLLTGYVFPKQNVPAPESTPPFYQAVTEMLDHLRAAILPGFDCTMEAACPHPESSEWHFYLPLRSDIPLQPQALATIFKTHPLEGFEGYDAHLIDLHTEDLKGFLHGFIDRLAVHPHHPEQWGVIDWKTNRLGDTPASYDLPSLRKCAMDHHYYLQALLYLVALRRHLGTQAHAQDAWIVFLRGISSGTDHGILHIQPKKELLDALDNLFYQP